MNFKKYSKQQFESPALNMLTAQKLAEQLQDDVSREIHNYFFSRILFVHVVWNISFPFPGSKCVTDNFFQKFFENTFSIITISHNDD